MIQKLLAKKQQEKERQALQEQVRSLEAEVAKLAERERELRGELENSAQLYEERASRYLIGNSWTVGLGNRLLFLVYCHLYGRATGRTVIPVWNDGIYAGEGENAFWVYFEPSEAFPIQQLPALESITDVAPAQWAGRIFNTTIDSLSEEIRLAPGSPYDPADDRFPRKEWKYYALWDLKRTERILVCHGAKSQLKTMPRELKDRLYPGQPDDDIRSHALRTIFRLRPELQDRLTHLRSTLGLAGERPTLGVHIRYTDRRPAAGLQEIFEQIRGFAREIQASTGHKPVVYLASDSKSVHDLVAQEQELEIVRQDLYLDPNGAALLYLKTPVAETIARTQEALLDMWILGGCQYQFLQGNSTFSLVSGYLANLSPDRVRWQTEQIDPEM